MYKNDKKKDVFSVGITTLRLLNPELENIKLKDFDTKDTKLFREI